MKKKYNYNSKDIYVALKRIGLKRNAIVYCHSNIGLSGKLNNFYDADSICRQFYNNIFRVIGKNGLLIVPTYTYSFGKNRYGLEFKKKEIFNKSKTPSLMGLFSEWIRKKKRSQRTNDPFFSSSLLGNYKRINLNISNNSFDENSLFSRLDALNAVFLNINFSGYTYIHYLERKLKVKYRFDKKFFGTMYKKKKPMRVEWKIFVRNKNKKKLIDNHLPLVNYMKKKKLIHTVNLGRGEISLTNARKIELAIRRKLKDNPLYLTYYNS